MRFTGIIDDPTRTHVLYVEFDTPAQGESELLVHLNSGGSPASTMEVGEPGDEAPRWVWKVTDDGRVVTITNASDTPAHNVELSLA